MPPSETSGNDRCGRIHSWELEVDSVGWWLPAITRHKLLGLDESSQLATVPFIASYATSEPACSAS